MLHNHNIEFREFDRDYAYAKHYKPVEKFPEDSRATFRDTRELMAARELEILFQ